MFDNVRVGLDDETALAALDGLPDFVCVCQDDTIHWINPAGLQLLNAADNNQVVGQRFTDFLGADYAALGSELYALLAEEKTPVQTKMKDLDGVAYDCELCVLSHFSGDAERYVIHARNISEFTRIAESLHLRENYLRDLINNSLSLICECQGGNIRFINQAGVKLLGAQAEVDVIGTPIQEIFHRDYRDIFATEFQEILNEDVFIPMRLKRLDDTYVDVDVALTPMGEEGGDSFLAEVHDITKHNQAVDNLRDLIETLESRVDERTISLRNEITIRLKAEEQLRYLATHDTLTGLPNRALLAERVESAVAGVARRGNMAAVLFIDLDGFKLVNDTLGHEAGDELLKLVARVLEESVRATDTIIRVGGDEFVIVITDAADRDAVATAAKKIIQRLMMPVSLSGSTANIGASIGIALCPDDSTDVDSLLTHADAAMYDVKNSGKNNFRFFSDMN